MGRRQVAEDGAGTEREQLATTRTVRHGRVWVKLRLNRTEQAVPNSVRDRKQYTGLRFLIGNQLRTRVETNAFPRECCRRDSSDSHDRHRPDGGRVRPTRRFNRSVTGGAAEAFTGNPV